jgi:DNA-binding PadR family transcriptional regulator
MVRYALLGLLREQRDYGYRLKRRFDQRMGAAWQLNAGQVYQTLRSLERAGLVVEACAESSSRYPERHLFEVTAKGRRVLERWLGRRPARPRPVRDETMIRLLLQADPENEADVIEQVRDQEHLYRRHLTRLQDQKRRLPATATGSERAAHFCLEADLLHTAAHLRWLEYCRLGLADEHLPPGSPSEATT